LDPALRFRVVFCRNCPRHHVEPCPDPSGRLDPGAISSPLERRHQARSNIGFRDHVARSPEGGRYTAVSAVDQIERRFGVRKLAGFPVYVSASLAMDDIRRGWLMTMASHLIFGVPATALLIALVLLAARQTKALHAEAESRQALEANLRHSQ